MTVSYLPAVYILRFSLFEHLECCLVDWNRGITDIDVELHTEPLDGICEDGHLQSPYAERTNRH
jgi:hypothetical protein